MPAIGSKMYRRMHQMKVAHFSGSAFRVAGQKPLHSMREKRREPNERKRKHGTERNSFEEKPTRGLERYLRPSLEPAKEPSHDWRTRHDCSDPNVDMAQLFIYVAKNRASVDV